MYLLKSVAGARLGVVTVIEASRVVLGGVAAVPEDPEGGSPDAGPPAVAQHGGVVWEVDEIVKCQIPFIVNLASKLTYP